MSKEVMIGVAIAGVLMVGLTAFFFISSSSSMKPLTIEGAKIYEIPKSAVVEEIDSSSAPVVKELLKEGLLAVFNGSADGVIGISSYDVAETDARDKLGRYISAVNENFQEKVKGKLTNVQASTSDSKNNSNFSQFSTEVFKSVSKSLSKSKQIGAKIIAKYYVNKAGVVEYHVLLLYNPQSAISQLIAQEKSMQNNYKASKQLFTDINDLFKEAFKDTPLK